MSCEMSYILNDKEDAMEAEVLEFPVDGGHCNCHQSMNDSSTFYVCDLCLNIGGNTMEVGAEMEIGMEECVMERDEKSNDCSEYIMDHGDNIPQHNLNDDDDAYDNNSNGDEEESEDDVEARWTIAFEMEKRRNKAKIDMIVDNLYALWLRSSNPDRIVMWSAKLVKLVAWCSIKKMTLLRRQMFGLEDE